LDVRYGARVVDSKGTPLGTVDHLMHNLSTGEITKFVVRRRGEARDLFVSEDEVSQISEDEVVLAISVDDR